MKKFALLLLPFLIVACQSSNEPVVTNTSRLNVTKNKIVLNSATRMDSCIVALECGCHFTLTVEKFTGDTSVIHYTQRDASMGATRVAVDVTADPLAPAGSYSAKLAILSTGGKGTYRDTIDVQYVK